MSIPHSLIRRALAADPVPPNEADTEDDSEDGLDLEDYDSLDIEASVPRCPICGHDAVKRKGASLFCDNKHQFAPEDAYTNATAQRVDAETMADTETYRAFLKAGLTPREAHYAMEGRGHTARYINLIARRVEPKDSEIEYRRKHASNPPEDVMPNPDKGGPGSAPNGMNQTAPDSDDTGKVEPIEDMSWFMGGLDLERDEKGDVKWPFTFKRIEKDFARPNKPGNPDQEPRAQDSTKPDTKDTPFVI